MGFFVEHEHAARGGAIDGERLFHEDVEALGDGVRVVDPAEGRRRGEDDDVTGGEAIDRFLIGVEADEFALFGHVDLRLEFVGEAFLELLVAIGEAVVEDVGHGDEFELAVLDRQGVLNGAAAAAAAANEGDADGVVFGGVDGRRGERCQGGDCGGLAGANEEFAARWDGA